MPWFDKALKSMQDTAGKTAFEADKLVRTNREGSVLSDMQQKAQARLVELGQAALALYRSGALADPAVATLAAELAELEGQVEKQKDKIEAIRSEQYQPGGHAPAVEASATPAEHAEPVAPVPAAPAEEPPATPAARAEPVSPALVEPAAAPALVECPNCHSHVKATVTFCPECGNRLK